MYTHLQVAAQIQQLIVWSALLIAFIQTYGTHCNTSSNQFDLFVLLFDLDMALDDHQGLLLAIQSGSASNQQVSMATTRVIPFFAFHLCLF